MREGRELQHPTTRQVLGRVEQTLGRVVITEVSDQYAIARLVSGDGAAIQPGDKARVPAGKVKLAVVALAANRTKMIEAAASELLQELERRGRFQIAFGDQVAVWVAQQNIPAEEFMAGRGVREAAARFKFPHLMAVHFTTVQGRLFMDVRVFSEALDAPRLQNALFVPSSVRPTQTFSGGPITSLRRPSAARCSPVLCPATGSRTPTPPAPVRFPCAPWRRSRSRSSRWTWRRDRKIRRPGSC